MLPSPSSTTLGKLHTMASFHGLSHWTRLNVLKLRRTSQETLASLGG
ncbi:hypothetical protein LEMLEM_LOCUS10602 [Lemmus lemmus]